MAESFLVNLRFTITDGGGEGLHDHELCRYEMLPPSDAYFAKMRSIVYREIDKLEEQCAGLEAVNRK